MIQSMTAFARVQKQQETGIFCWEIRSVNHRYFDLSFRLPESFRFLENSLRAMIRSSLARGKVECQLKFKDYSATSQKLFINERLVNGLIEVGSQLSTSKQLANDLTLSALLHWPGVVEEIEPNFEIQAKQAEQLFADAITLLVSMRQTEGQALREQIENRLIKLTEEVEGARQLVKINTEQVKEKLLTRLQVLQLEVNNPRLEQEIALILTRLDVSEELDRLQIHIREVAKTLAQSEATGRRLDFLMQELNREANTLTAKSDSVALSQAAVNMKVLIEQMREQIQNIE